MTNDRTIDTCRHLIHSMHKRCKKGVDCKQFNWRDSPCFYSDTVQLCAHRQPFTAEEKRQSKIEMETVNKMFDDLHTRKSNICPHCKSKIKSMSQTGRCVYASPCRCRLWQGRIPEMWK